ncbi:restriction endonuclease subunit S [Faecalibacterium prausnitzii]
MDIVKLKDLTVDGKGTYGVAAPAVEYQENLPTYLRITDILDDGTLNLSELKSVKVPDSKRYMLRPNDIVFARTGGSTGRNYFYDGTDGAFVYAGFLIKFSLDPKKVNPKFIKYFCQSEQYKQWVRSFNTGSTRGNINAQTFGNMEIALPGRKQQDHLVSVLESMGKKIKLNKKINDNLEQQAAALFSSLYNRSNTEVRYTDLIQILGGGTPKTGETAYWNGNIAFFTPKDVGTPYTFITEKTITEEGLSHCNSRLYPVNTVFVTARGTVGKVGLSGVPMAMNQSCYALVGKETHQLLVYFYTLKVVDKLKHKASGAVFDAITTRDFESEQIMKLSDDDARAFLCVAEPMFQDILNNSIENLRLSTLRDFLLPKLMSGEIDVSNIQF